MIHEGKAVKTIRPLGNRNLRHRMFDGWQYNGFGISAQSISPFGVSYNIGKNKAISKFLDKEWLHKNGGSYEAISYYQLHRHELLNSCIIG